MNIVNFKKYLIFPTILLITVNFTGCDKGIAPLEVNEKPGFSGKITFFGDWPIDVTRTHLVIFKKPLNSAADFNADNLAFVSKEIPKGTSSLDYSTLDEPLIGKIPAGTYNYIAVAQSKTILLSLNRIDWNVVGLFHKNSNPGTPGSVTVPESELIIGVDIEVDFSNPPVQPPGGLQ